MTVPVLSNLLLDLSCGQNGRRFVTKLWSLSAVLSRVENALFWLTKLLGQKKNTSKTGNIQAKKAK